MSGGLGSGDATPSASGPAVCSTVANPSVNGVANVGPDDFNATGQVQTTPSCLEYIDLTIGSGAQPQPGQSVTVQYTGWTMEGKKFDSSRDRGQPFQFVLGRGDVIAGWDEGLASMKVGGRRKLIIPPNLAYGSRGAPPDIAPNATLVFIVEIVSAG
ncbi:MAG: FKBP-type peptidyl-prolyl cis-trans isomerase [Candidatus Dormibacteria bacterium]